MNLPLMSREVISAGAAMLIAQGGIGEEERSHERTSGGQIYGTRSLPIT